MKNLQELIDVVMAQDFEKKPDDEQIQIIWQNNIEFFTVHYAAQASLIEYMSRFFARNVIAARYFGFPVRMLLYLDYHAHIDVTHSFINRLVKNILLIQNT